ncbi:MAG: ABC transporter permease [Deltaproteobacteria bacterium]
MARQIFLIKQGTGFSLNLRDLWRYRELLYFLTWRDIKVRYKQTIIGAGWAVLQPLLTMVVFTIFFGRIASIPSEGIPYPIFSYSGLLLWTYFSTSVSSSSNSLVGSANLITKVYFPRLIIPLSSAVAGVVDYFIALTILVLMMLYYGFAPGLSIVFLPATLVLAFISATGVGLWLSALNVKYRDVRYAIPFFIQLMLFATPVIYPADLAPERFRWLMALNPISGIIDAHRACVLGYKPIDWDFFLLSSAASVVIFLTGVVYFRRVERTFADVI